MRQNCGRVCSAQEDGCRVLQKEKEDDGAVPLVNQSVLLDEEIAPNSRVCWELPCNKIKQSLGWFMRIG